MVNNTATALGRNGVQDWLWQRISAFIIASYLLFLGIYIISHPELNFVQWQNLFSYKLMKIFSGLFLLSLVIHAWIGLWVVSTDYLKCVCLRVFFQIGIILLNLSFLFWGIQILWSV